MDIRKLKPYLFLLLGLGAIGGVALTFLLPSQILKPEANLSRELVKETYELMILEVLKGFPEWKMANIDREDCWNGGKTICVYGWYEERKRHAHLVSFTWADKEEAKHGILEGWWWEVDYGKKIVRPVWMSAMPRDEYERYLTDGFLGSHGREGRHRRGRACRPEKMNLKSIGLFEIRARSGRRTYHGTSPNRWSLE